MCSKQPQHQPLPTWDESDKKKRDARCQQHHTKAAFRVAKKEKLMRSECAREYAKNARAKDKPRNARDANKNDGTTSTMNVEQKKMVVQNARCRIN